jgi:predicted dehydrogenase
MLARNGIHLLIEKPLSISLDGIDELHRIVDEKKLAAGVAYVFRAHPALTQMRKAITEGRFGKPVELRFDSGQNFPFFRPAYREIYYAKHASGSGAVQDALTHGLNASEWLIGPAERIVADLSHQVLADVDVEDTVHVLARHHEVLASYCLNQHQAANEWTITIACTGGIARFEYHACRWRSMRSPGDAWTDHELPILARDELFIAQANAFLDAVEGKRAQLCTIDEAAASGAA